MEWSELLRFKLAGLWRRADCDRQQCQTGYYVETMELYSLSIQSAYCLITGFPPCSHS